MDWITELKLNALSRKISPDRAFIKQLEAKLKAESQLTLAWIPMWKLAAVPSLLLILATGSTGVYAYTSDQVLPSHALYSVRQNMEKIESKITVGSSNQALIAVKHLQRRLHEDDLLLSKHAHIATSRVDDFTWRLQQLKTDVAKLPQQDQTKFSQPISSLTEGIKKIKLEDKSLK